MRALACLALLSLAACAAQIQVTVPPSEQALRRPENRSGIVVEDELARLGWLPESTSSMSSGARLAGLAQLTGRAVGPPVEWMIATRVSDGRAVVSFSGWAAAWRDGQGDDEDERWQGLTAARDASAFHAPVQGTLGKETFWAIGDLIPVALHQPEGESLVTIEIYDADPRAGRSRPLRPSAVLVAARRGAGGDETRREPRDLVVGRPGGFFFPDRQERSAEGRLTSVTFAAWSPDLWAVLGGQVASDLIAPSGELAMEHLLNDSLVEWKSRVLPGWLSGASRDALEKAAISTEKGMLQLDLKSRLAKDEIDAAARQGAGSQPALTEKVALLDQRRMLLTVVLGAIKSTRAQAR